MHSTQSLYDDCCLLSNSKFNIERIRYLLERRFRSNSIRTSFDFKSFYPEKPANETKMPRSFLRVDQKRNFQRNQNDDFLLDSSSSSSFSSTNSKNFDEQTNSQDHLNDDDYLKRLADWIPNEEEFSTNSLLKIDDRQSTSVHSSNLIDENLLPQLDGNNDCSCEINASETSKENRSKRVITKGRIEKLSKDRLRTLRNTFKTKFEKEKVRKSQDFLISNVSQQNRTRSKVFFSKMKIFKIFFFVSFRI